MFLRDNAKCKFSVKEVLWFSGVFPQPTFSKALYPWETIRQDSHIGQQREIRGNQESKDGWGLGASSGASPGVAGNVHSSVVPRTGPKPESGRVAGSLTGCTQWLFSHVYCVLWWSLYPHAVLWCHCTFAGTHLFFLAFYFLLCCVNSHCAAFLTAGLGVRAQQCVEHSTVWKLLTCHVSIKWETFGYLFSQ